MDDRVTRPPGLDRLLTFIHEIIGLVYQKCGMCQGHEIELRKRFGMIPRSVSRAEDGDNAPSFPKHL